MKFKLEKYELAEFFRKFEFAFIDAVLSGEKGNLVKCKNLNENADKILKNTDENDIFELQSDEVLFFVNDYYCYATDGAEFVDLTEDFRKFMYDKYDLTYVHALDKETAEHEQIQNSENDHNYPYISKFAKADSKELENPDEDTDENVSTLLH